MIATVWMPAFAGMTVKKIGGGAIIVDFRLGRVDTMNLTRGRKGRKDAIVAPLFPIFTPAIPAKAGIHRVGSSVYAPRIPPKFRTSTAVGVNVNAP